MVLQYRGIALLILSEMTYSELFEDILREIIVEYNDQLSDGDTLFDSVGFDPLPSVSNSLLAALPDSLMSLKPMLEGIMNFSSDLSFNGSDDVPDYSNLRIKKAQYDNEKNKRLFFLNDQDLSVFDSAQLYTSTYDDKLMSILIKVCYTPDFRTEFLRFLTGPHTTATFHYIYDTTLFDDTAFNCWDLYHYALLRYLNRGDVIKRVPALNFPSFQILHSIPFSDTIIYRQYIDILDVISEINHSDDILSAFMKMYQILEYLVYRERLVKIVKDANIKQSFVRQVIGIDKAYSNGERTMFTSRLFKIISSLHGDITTADFTQNLEKFCKKYYPLTKDGNPYFISSICGNPDNLNSGIAKFIYDTRCAIVHNKEAEFHITYFNYDEYKAIIPIMDKIIKLISQRIVSLINAPNSTISFDKANFELY